MREYNYSTIYDSFNNNFPADVARSYLNLLPITIDDIHWTPKYSNIPLIHFQLLFMLPTEYLLVCLPPFLISHNFLSCILMILTLTYHQEWQTFPYQYENRILLQIPWWENMPKKSRFDCSMYSINKILYYCHGTIIMSSQLRTWFIKNHHCIAFFYIWLVCFLPFLHCLSCWTYFCAWFIPHFLFPHSSNYSVWYDWIFQLVLSLFSIWMHVMTSRSGRCDVLTNFMPIAGF